MKTFNTIVTLITASLFFFSCSTEKPEEVPVPAPIAKNVYTAGYEYNAAGIQVAKYWKNDLETIITSGAKYAEATDVIVHNDIVYVTGSEIIGTAYQPFVWKFDSNGNRTTQSLPTVSAGVRDAYALAIAVSGNDIYVAGKETNAAGNRVAKYWKNGIATILSDGTTSCDVTCIAVVDNDVYVGGSERNAAGKYIAKYWKNGIAVNLTSGTLDAAIFSMVVVENTVYASGYERIDGVMMASKYWKNGVPTSLTSNSQAISFDMAVVGSDVYVADISADASATVNIGKIWKNGLVTNASDTNLTASSIAVVGSSVFAAGNQKTQRQERILPRIGKME